MTGSGVKEPGAWGLYLVSDRHQTNGRDLVEVLEEAAVAGVQAIQLREKDLSAAELYVLATRVQGIARNFGLALTINDRVDLALAIAADGVQLTRNSLPLPCVRKLVGSRMLVGISCHTIDNVREATESGADFIVLGPVYATPSKMRYGPPLSPSIIQKAKSFCRLPVLAIGGITAARVPEVIRAGADGVAVISAVLSSPHPGASVQDLIKTIVSAKSI
jgi:thiamine-phosphate pyrophosphorylase